MAVYTHLSPPEIAAIASAFGLGPVRQASPIAEGVENSNYLLESGEGARHILTVYEKRMKTDELPFFLHLLEHLAQKGLCVPRPLPTPEGTMTVPLRDTKRAAVVTFLDGASPTRVATAHLAELGRMIAALHEAVGDFGMARANDLGLAGWRRLAEKIGTRADEIAPGLTRRIADELAFLEARWPQHLPAGVVHADLFVDNVFFEGERLSGVIDFYFACTDAFLYDLAIAMNAWCFGPDGFARDRATALLSAYRAARSTGEADWACLPLLTRGAALRFLLTRAYDWLHRQPGALVTVKDPLEYDRILRHHQAVADVVEIGG